MVKVLGSEIKAAAPRYADSPAVSKAKEMVTKERTLVIGLNGAYERQNRMSKVS